MHWLSFSIPSLFTDVYDQSVLDSNVVFRSWSRIIHSIDNLIRTNFVSERILRCEYNVMNKTSEYNIFGTSCSSSDNSNQLNIAVTKFKADTCISFGLGGQSILILIYFHECKLSLRVSRNNLWGIYFCLWNNSSPFILWKSFAGLCGALLIGVGVVGAGIAGVFVDKTQKFEEVTKFCYALAAVSAAFFAIVSRSITNFLLYFLILSECTNGYEFNFTMTQNIGLKLMLKSKQWLLFMIVLLKVWWLRN